MAFAIDVDTKKITLIGVPIIAALRIVSARRTRA